MDDKRHISQRDMARLLGVSVASVCRALKGDPGVGEDLRVRIRQLAEQYDYRPNPFAQSLRNDATHIIGVLVPDIVTYFYSSILESIEKTALKHGYFSVLSTSNEKLEEEKQSIQNLLNLHVDGLLICLSQQTDHYEHLLALAKDKVPVVLFDRVCLPELFSSVTVDDTGSAYTATRYLLKTGCRRIAFLGGSNKLQIIADRKHGYLQALKDFGVKIEPELIVCDEMEFNSGLVSTTQLLDLPEPPDAIFAMNDILAVAAKETIESRGLRIPEDISLIGYIDERQSLYTRPKLTAVRHPTKTMGCKACELLMEQMQGHADIRHEVVKAKLDIRQSTRT